MFLLLIAMVSGLAAGQELDFNYDNQSAWQFLPDSSCGGLRQSPIDIVVDNVQESELLIDLVFTGWNNPVNGTFVNTHHGVQFTPTANSTVARFENHRGIYELLQFHFHWGTEAGAGTEHFIDSSQLDSELHFVTRKMGENSSSVAGDALAVVSVLLDIDTSAGVTGIWEQLTPVPTANGAETIVNNLRYSDLLPENRDYYYYEGSLTTPLCTEIVQWFVLKEPVSIPAAIVEAFREVEGAHGEILTENVRVAQALNGRTVETPRSVLTVSFTGDTPTALADSIEVEVVANKPHALITCALELLTRTDSGIGEVGPTVDCSSGRVRMTYNVSSQSTAYFRVKVNARTATEKAVIRRRVLVDPSRCIVNLINSGVTVNGNTAVIEFEANGPYSDVRCNLDRQAFFSCSSPLLRTGLLTGAHSIKILPIGPACGRRNRSAAKANFII